MFKTLKKKKKKKEEKGKREEKKGGKKERDEKQGQKQLRVCAGGNGGNQNDAEKTAVTVKAKRQKGLQDHNTTGTS